MNEQINRIKKPKVKVEHQSFSKKSQSMCLPEVFLERLNNRFNFSMCTFSAAWVWTSHTRNVTVPCVWTMTSSPVHFSSIPSLKRTLDIIRLTKPAEKDALPEWWMRPPKSDGNHIVIFDVVALTSKMNLHRGTGRHWFFVHQRTTKRLFGLTHDF